MNIVWFIFFTIVFICVHVWIYRKFALRNIQYKRSFSEQAVFVGETIEMIDEVSNL